jgi:uncharacterized membrane protein
MLLDTAIKGKIESAQQHESNLRSFLKTVSWRVVGTIDTMIISYLITGNTAMAMSIGSVEVVSKMVLYFLHERAWSTVKLKR